MKEQKSGLWKHGLLLTLLFGFTVMIVGGVMMYRSRAPIPDRVTGPDGATLFTAADIQHGQDLFRKRGLMDYGTVLGHGAYLGPDYTAEALHLMTEAMRRAKTPGLRLAEPSAKRPAVDAEVAQELKDQPLRRRRSTLHRRPDGRMERHRGATTRKLFAEGQLERALPKGALLPVAEGGGDPAQSWPPRRQLAAFVTWTAWLSVGQAARRPRTPTPTTGRTIRPPGNTATAGSMMWSAASVGRAAFLPGPDSLLPAPLSA